MLLKQEFKFTNGSKGKEIEFRSVQTIKQNWENNILNKLSLFHITFHKFLFIKYLFWHFNVFCWYYQNQSLHSNIHHHWCFSFVWQCFITIVSGSHVYINSPDNSLVVWKHTFNPAVPVVCLDLVLILQQTDISDTQIVVSLGLLVSMPM